VQLAALDEQEERWKDAADQCARALQISPDNAELARPGDCAHQRGRSGRARDLLAPLELRYRSDPKRTRSLGLLLTPLGFAFQELHEYANAIQIFEEARAKFPEDDSIVFPLGAAYERAGRDADAERTFRDLLAKDPLNAPALNYLATCCGSGPIARRGGGAHQRALV
jgi:Flp pilus assembly protein TadD